MAPFHINFNKKFPRERASERTSERLVLIEIGGLNATNFFYAKCPFLREAIQKVKLEILGTNNEILIGDISLQSRNPK